MKKQRFTIGAVVFWCVMALSGAAWCEDNSNGTVTINGLVWLKDAGCLGTMKWNDAMARANSIAHRQCGLSDNSRPGDWRLPTITELQAVHAYKGQFKNVQANYYWSSDTFQGITFSAWGVNMYDGYVGWGGSASLYVWPVRAER